VVLFDRAGAIVGRAGHDAAPPRNRRR